MKNSMRYLLIAAFVIYGLLSIANQAMPLWVNVGFSIVGLVVLFVLSDYRKSKRDRTGVHGDKQHHEED